MSTTTRAPRRKLPAMLVIGLVIFALMVILGVIAPIIWGTTANALTADVREGPSGAHPLGTDALGRDILLRTLVATRLTLVMSLCATAVAVVLGTLLGAGSVIASRRLSALGARGIDLLVSYPPIITALAITAIFRPGPVTVVLAIGIAFSPQYARLTNTLAASVSTRDYVVAARSLGLGRGRTLTQHVLPNIAAPILVLTSVGFATSIGALSGLSYLGLGIQAPAYDWGALLSSGLRDLFVNPAEAMGPAVAILLAGLGAGLMGDGLAKFWDPRQRSAPRRKKRLAGAAPIPPSDAALGVETPPGAVGPLDEEAADIDGPTVVSVRNLRIASVTEAGEAELVRGVSLDIRRGEIVGIVGESGSGKSLTAMSLARLLSPALSWSAGRLDIAGHPLADGGRPPTALATDVGIVFQDPSSCFNPALTLGAQLTEVLRVHRGIGRAQARAMAVERLREVRVSAPEQRLRQYPHELSGGMRQRAMIAMALLNEPKLLIADEPTTALDVTVQADVLRLLHEINTEHHTAILLISHDIHVVSQLCHRVCVMYAGKIVEEVSVADLRAGRVRHPYTKALLAASPTIQADRDTQPLSPLPGRPPRPLDIGPGCSFADRCPLVMPRCAVESPLLNRSEAGAVACHAAEPELAEVKR